MDTAHNFTKAEAVFYALRKTKEGVIVSFVIHPNELSDALTRAPIGTRVVLAVAEITDEAQATTQHVANSVEQGPT